MEKGGENLGEEIRKVIEKNNERFGEGIRRGDASAVGALYTEDAILMPPNSEMMRGRRDVEGFWGAAIKMGVRDARLKTVELTESGEELHEVGNYALRIEPAGARPFEDRGKYVVIWKRDKQGSWRLHRDIWNSSLPSSK